MIFTFIQILTENSVYNCQVNSGDPDQMPCLICVCAVCICPTKRSLGLYELKLTIQGNPCKVNVTIINNYSKSGDSKYLISQSKFAKHKGQIRGHFS